MANNKEPIAKKCRSLDISPAVMGYGNKKWLKAISDQAAKLGHISNLFYSEPYIELAHQLTARTGMKRAFFANGGRGDLVVTDDLVTALESGHLAGAAVDVTDPEPVAPDSPLFKLPNVIVTPHYAPTTVESATRVSKIAAENINAVLAGQEPVGRIV